MGAITRVDAAVNDPYDTAKSSIKPAIPTGRVRVPPAVNASEYMYSFQELMTLKIVTATIPGRARGRTILRNRPILEQPSIRADSSISIGTSLIKEFIIQITKGRLTVVCAIATDVSVPWRPIILMRKKRGTKRDIGAIILQAKIINIMAFLLRNLNLARL